MQIKFELGTTVKQAGELLGIDLWEAKKVSCFDKNSQPISGLFYLENSQSEKIINTKSVGKVYQESSHSDMLNFFNSLLENNSNLILDSGIVLGGGTNIILQARWNKDLEVTENHIINPAISYIIDHSGLKANRIVQISKCLWCCNQLPMLLSNKRSQLIKFGHYKNQNAVIEQATNTYLSLEQELEENLALYRQWSKTYISKETFDQLVNALLICKDAKLEKPEVYLKLEEKFYYGDGCKGSTLWDFINCVTEYCRDINYRDLQNKIKSELLGSSYLRSHKAALIAIAVCFSQIINFNYDFFDFLINYD
jgi:Domain of unknown function (DUF932)